MYNGNTRRRRNREKKADEIFETIMNKYFPKLMSDGK